jgi:hypothetical protein
VYRHVSEHLSGYAQACFMNTFQTMLKHVSRIPFRLCSSMFHEYLSDYAQACFLNIFQTMLIAQACFLNPFQTMLNRVSWFLMKILFLGPVTLQ